MARLWSFANYAVLDREECLRWPVFLEYKYPAESCERTNTDIIRYINLYNARHRHCHFHLSMYLPVYMDVGRELDA